MLATSAAALHAGTQSACSLRFLKGDSSMDAFETSIGYRSLFPTLEPPEMQALQQLSQGDLLRIAKDRFDTSIAEILRSTGEWHWKLKICDLADNRAEELSFG